MMKNKQLQRVPVLRFQEFEGEWEESSIGRILKIGSGSDYKGLNSGQIPVYGSGGLMTYVDQYLYNGESVCIGRKGTIDKPMFLDGKFWTVDTLFYTYDFVESQPRFVFLLFQNINWQKYNEASGVPSLSKSTIYSIVLNIPSLPEQQKIATFLTLIDTKIQQLTQKKNGLEAYKKGVMQRIFKQEIRFRKEDGGDFEEWTIRKFSDVLFEHKERSNGTEEVFSVSVHKGLINQIEHLGRSFSAANTSHYNLVKPGDLVYTKSPTGEFPLGIIKQSRVEENVIVSPLYGVFTPETEALGYILNDYFCSKENTHNYLHSIIQKGAKNTINITNKTFLSKSLRLPISPKEQERIADFLKKNLILKQWRTIGGCREVSTPLMK